MFAKTQILKALGTYTGPFWHLRVRASRPHESRWNPGPKPLTLEMAMRETVSRLMINITTDAATAMVFSAPSQCPLPFLLSDFQSHYVSALECHVRRHALCIARRFRVTSFAAEITEVLIICL